MQTILVTTQELAEHSQWRVFDCRHDLLAPMRGAELYAQGHIDGALHAHLDRDLSAAPTGVNGRHPLPDADAFSLWLGMQGIRCEDQIVAYDDSGGIYAARLWWMMRWVGHQSISVLDGGYTKWLAEGRPTTDRRPMFQATLYQGKADDSMRVDLAAVEANIATSRFQLLDARGANRYAGQDETMDPVAGHIPGALNRPYTLNLNVDGCFKPPEVLRAEFIDLLGGLSVEQMVSQCGSGVTACHNLLAMEVAGLSGARLYPGSWSEWCSDSKRPVVTGSQP